jgi:hypothetical protein
MKDQPIINGEAAREIRGSKRNHGFLAASIEVAGETWKVRLRNISQTGALVEAPAKLRIGTPVVLSRLHVSIPATVVREDKNSAGLSFHEPIASGTVDLLRIGAGVRKQDLPALAPIPVRAASAAGSRNGKQPLPPTSLRPSRDPLDQWLARELQNAQSLLEQLGEPISNDHVFLRKHGASLQKLDFVAQLLGQLARIVSTQDKECAINQIEIGDLRSRFSRAAAAAAAPRKARSGKAA